MRAWIVSMGLVAAGAVSFVGCSSDECSTNADCPAGRLCRLGLCALDPNQGDGTTIGDSQLPDIPLDCSAATAADLVLNEIMADPPSGADIDQNGTPSTTEDEFVEVVNVSSRAVAMTNVQIDIGGKRVVLGTQCLNPNQARVVFGSMGLPSLTNSGATVSLLVDGVVSQSHTYGSDAGHDESITLQPQLDPNGTWVRSGVTWGPAYTPGTCSDNNAFPNCGSTPVVEQDVETVDGSDSTVEVVVPTCDTPPTATDLVINEIMADPGPTIGGNDANGDGLVDSADDEFIEIVNVGTSTLLLDGSKLTAGTTAAFTFPAGTCVPPNGVVLVFGKYTGQGAFGAALAFGWSGLSLTNGGDSVAVTAADGTTVLATASYGAEGDNDQSIVRQSDLDPTAAFVRHSQAPNSGGAKMSPGFCQSGATFPDCGSPPVEVVESTDVVESTEETTTPEDTNVPPDDTTVTETVEDTGPECGPLATAADLVINEIMQDPDVDYNGGGLDTSDDEFVEVVNRGTGPVRLDGLFLYVKEVNKYPFPAGLCLQPGEAIVVFGSGARYYGASGATDLVTDHPGLVLANASTTVSIRASAAEVLETETVGQAVKQSWTRSPDATLSVWAKHKDINAGLGGSPGACTDGVALPGCLSD